jgi:hypothetical protein
MFSPGNEPWPSWPGQAWTKGSGRWAHTPNMSLGITCISACIAIRFSAYYGNRVNRYICIYTHIYMCVCEYEFYLYRGSMEHVYMQKLCVYHLNYAYIIICIYIYLSSHRHSRISPQHIPTYSPRDHPKVDDFDAWRFGGVRTWPTRWLVVLSCSENGGYPKMATLNGEHMEKHGKTDDYHLVI